MEMEGIYCDSDIVSVNSLNYIVCCSELIDRAVWCSAELQGNLDVFSDFI